MSRLTVLRCKLFLSGIHAILLLGPLALLGIALEKFADGANWLSDKLEVATGWGGKLLLPEWWPSHRILRAIYAEHQRRREQKADELHDDHKRRMFSRIGK